MGDVDNEASDKERAVFQDEMYNNAEMKVIPNCMSSVSRWNENSKYQWPR